MSAAEAPTSYAELASILEALPVLVRENRRRLGLSLRGAARALDMAPAVLSRCENRESEPSLTHAIRLVRWLGQADTARADELHGRQQ